MPRIARRKSNHNRSSAYAEFIVEKILDSRTRSNGTREYFLKWKGFPLSECTWEPEHNLGCPDLIKEFNERQKDRNSKPAASTQQVRSIKQPPPLVTSHSSASKNHRSNSNETDSLSLNNHSNNEESNDAHESSSSSPLLNDMGESSMLLLSPQVPKSPSLYKTASLESTEEFVRQLPLDTGFDRGLEPEKIVGISDMGDQLFFLMKWRGTDETDLVFAKTANMRCPQIVIKYYEDHMVWNHRERKINLL